MDGHDDDTLQSCHEVFFEEVGEDDVDDHGAEGTDESSSDDDVYGSAATSRSGQSAGQAADVLEGRSVTKYAGPLIARVGPLRLKSCRSGKVCTAESKKNIVA
jgi:hypothetical protein